MKSNLELNGEWKRMNEILNLKHKNWKTHKKKTILSDKLWVEDREHVDFSSN